MEIFAFHAPIPGFFEPGSEAATVRLETVGGADQLQVFLRHDPDNEEVLVAMEPATASGRRTLWSAELPFDRSAATTRYAFKMVSADRQWWLAASGMSNYYPERDWHFRVVPGYRPAAWVRDQVFYQVFPDRFRDGDPGNNVASGTYLYEGKPVIARRWDELPTPGDGAREFFGGDLAGIREALPYLRELGVTALYLNPVFDSPSSHRYDTIDYHRVDPHLGGNEELTRLCAQLHAHGMRIVLDAVVNHTSERHPWFDRFGEHGGGAYGHPDTVTRGFYVFEDPDDPDSYVGWYGTRTLPVLDMSSERLQSELYAGEEAVLRVWLRPPYSVDGWRLDVVHMLGEGRGAGRNHDHVRAIRQAIREENPEAFVLGEHFFEAPDWLQGDQEDGAMNYHGFTLPLWAFLAGRDGRGHPVRADAEDFDQMLARARARIPFEMQLSQLNLLGSHDVPRIRTVLEDDRLLFAAVTLLLSYVGTPCIYYGDEIGLEGGADPDCRRPFPWQPDRWLKGLREHYRRLIALRSERASLRAGAFQTLHASGDQFAFCRRLDDDIVLVAMTRGRAGEVQLPVWRAGGRCRFRDALDDTIHVAEEGLLQLELPARSARILVSDG